MSVMIQLRNVPDEVHRKLKTRAAAAGMSLSAYILKDVQRLAEEPTTEEWLANIKRMKPLRVKESSEQAVRAIRDSR